MIECPRFKFCSVNKCPLDTESRLRDEMKNEEKCGVSKNIRFKIGQKHNLTNLGLTKAEFAARKRFEQMSPEERDRLIQNGTEALKNVKTRSSQSQT